MTVTEAEKNLLKAAQNWAQAERRLRETQGFYARTPQEAELIKKSLDPEESHRISLQCDVTEQALLDADRALATAMGTEFARRLKEEWNRPSLAYSPYRSVIHRF